MQFEVDIIVSLQKISSQGLTTFFNIISLIGSYVGFIVLFLAMFFLRRKFAYYFGCCFLGGVVGNYVLKHLIDRPRPFVSHPEIVNLTSTVGESMPSSHAMCAIMLVIFLVTFVCMLTDRTWVHVVTLVLSTALYVLTCLSRLYLGMHYLTDLVVGTVIGAAIAFLGIFLYKKREKNDKTKVKFNR